MTTVDLKVVADALVGYEIGGEIGRGAWGIVIEGTHRQLSRKVAIKQLPRSFGADESVRSRFVAEARLLAALDHPHIVPVFDYVEKDGVCLLVMEWLPGGTVWDRFKSSGITPPEACAIAMATSAGLHYAHGKGVLHRDIKPENLIFNEAGMLKVTDFGIAKVLTGAEAGATRAGEVLGTPAYMAPEQAQGKELTPATDVYATGVLLYELLAGSLPFFEQADAMAMLFQRVYEQPIHINEKAANVPAPLAAATMRALSTDTAQRYATAEEFGVAIASAATESWGPQWTDGVNFEILSSGAIASAIQRPTAVPGAPAATVAAQVVPGGHIRPAGPAHVEGVSALDASPSDMVPLKDLVQLPAAPMAQILAAGALFILAVIVALIGLGKPDRTSDFPAGAVSLGGLDPTSGEPITFDVTRPVEIKLTGRPGKPITDARLSFEVLGVRLSAAQTKLPVAEGTTSAKFDAGGAKFIVAGEVTGRLRFLNDGAEVGSVTFPARSEQPFYLTAPGVGSVVLFLFVFAYGESFLRPLRRGRKKISGFAGTVAMGGLSGVAVVVLFWAVLSKEPTLPTVIVCASLGLGAGVAAGLAGLKSGKRRSIMRKETQAARMTGAI